MKVILLIWSLILLGCSASTNAQTRAEVQPSATSRTASSASTASIDPDHDGVIGPLDQCPNAAEDIDQVADEDGCPELDQDCDRVADREDLCPLQAEDMDGFEDHDGCVDPDNDRDRIADRCDRCPDRPEIYNGTFDEDGCPDRGLIVQPEESIMIVDRVFFARNSQTISTRALPLLQAIVQTLLGNPQITETAVVGHATVDEPNATQLSQRRAHAVHGWLIDHGVPANRLVEVAMGTRVPSVEGRTEDAGRANRCASFVIMSTTSGPQYNYNGSTFVRSPDQPVVDAPDPPPTGPVDCAPLVIHASAIRGVCEENHSEIAGR